MPVRRLTLVAAALLTSLGLAFGSCSNTCPYGSEGSHASDCKSRPGPSAEEAQGWRAAALAPRLTELRRRGVTSVAGLRVNRWGEVWVKTAAGKRIVLDVHATTGGRLICEMDRTTGVCAPLRE